MNSLIKLVNFTNTNSITDSVYTNNIQITVNEHKKVSDENDYKGGNLKFDFGPHSIKERYHTCTEIRPKGSIIVFPSYIYHQVTPITEGTRYSLVLWINGKPFK